MSTIEQRPKAIEKIVANSVLENQHTDAADGVLQRGYIAGTVIIEDLLQHAGR